MDSFTIILLITGLILSVAIVCLGGYLGDRKKKKAGLSKKEIKKLLHNELLDKFDENNTNEGIKLKNNAFKKNKIHYYNKKHISHYTGF